MLQNSPVGLGFFFHFVDSSDTCVVNFYPGAYFLYTCLGDERDT